MKLNPTELQYLRTIGKHIDQGYYFDIACLLASTQLDVDRKTLLSAIWHIIEVSVGDQLWPN